MKQVGYWFVTCIADTARKRLARRSQAADYPPPRSSKETSSKSSRSIPAGSEPTVYYAIAPYVCAPCAATSPGEARSPPLSDLPAPPARFAPGAAITSASPRAGARRHLSKRMIKKISPTPSFTHSHHRVSRYFHSSNFHLIPLRSRGSSITSMHQTTYSNPPPPP